MNYDFKTIIWEMLPEQSIASLVECYYGRTSTSLRGKNSRRWTLLKEVRAVEIEVLNIFRNEEVLQNHQEGINTIRTNHTCTDNT